jgi:flagellar basal-body rod protein FlgG
MIKALYTCATGMKAQQLYVDNIANNLANVNTVGFKRSQVNFQDLLYDTIISAGAESAQGFEIPSGLQIGGGVRAISTTKVFSQGTPQNTNRNLDLAIQGAGFFQITRPDGTIVYSRDGAFQLNSQGEIVTSDGLRLTPSTTIDDAIAITIGTDGTVSVQKTDGSVAPAGQMTLVTFVNPAGLESLGRNLYRETPASGPATVATPGEQGAGEIMQGFLERSNVEVITELVDLIMAQRAYEINSRAIRASDEMLSTANQISR